jgi:Tfp pilus assembly protein PilN
MTARQINLLPPEIAQRRRARQILLMVGMAGAGLLVILVLVFLIQTARLAGERNKLTEAKKQNAALQVQVDNLSQFAQLQSTLKTKETLLGTLTRNEVRWSVLLNDISVVIPSDVWLTNFTGNALGGTNAPAAGAPLGTLTFNGNTFTHLDVAKWLSRLAGVREFLSPYLSLSSKSGTGLAELVNFNSTVQLSDAALRRNQVGGARNP